MLENLCTTTEFASVDGPRNLKIGDRIFPYSLILNFYKINKSLVMVYGSFVLFSNYSYGTIIPEKFRPKTKTSIVFNREFGKDNNYGKLDLSTGALIITPSGEAFTDFPYDGESYNGFWIYRLD